MNENAERINGWAAMIGVIAAMGSYAVTGQIIPGVWWMLLLSATMVMGFILWSLSQEVDDDNDGPGGGLMQPVYAPSPSWHVKPNKL